jgi:hypothetical protein
MAFKLKSGDLANLAEQLDRIKASGITVETFVLGSNKIMLGWENGEPVIVGITAGNWSGQSQYPPGHGPVIRAGAQPPERRNR